MAATAGIGIPSACLPGRLRPVRRPVSARVCRPVSARLPDEFGPSAGAFGSRLGPVARRAHRGRVSDSIRPSQRIACSGLAPHIASVGCNERHTAGRRCCPKSLHRRSWPSWTQRTPAGLPPGIPGIGLEIEGAIQQAPQPSRQFMGFQRLAGIRETKKPPEGGCLVPRSIGSGGGADGTRTRDPRRDRPVF